MRRLALTLALCVGCWLAAGAQSTFTEQLQQSKVGEGKVTVTQSKTIDELVNNPSMPATTTTTPTPATTTPVKPQQTVKLSVDDLTDTSLPYDSIDHNRKIMKGQKVNGFRVQIFAGGNGRVDRQKAERIGDEIKTLFPNEPVYVHFYAPRWICRMGNYRTYEEAHDILTRVKSLGYPSAVIVKGKITVYYP
ncbi:MAG: SPOR domain-containing protein [Prevotella sp.]|nr:SPOR domain-containing protein [Prevotella sp.]MBR2229926.1 SPOR domain-containing protein [Prevotella sp.]